MALMDELQRFIRPLKNRVMNMIMRGLITAVNDNGQIQIVQVGVQDGEVQDDVDRIQEYGFTSRPIPGETEAVIVFLGGNRDHPVVIATDSGPNRPELKEGESAMYSADELIKVGDKVYLGSNADGLPVPPSLSKGLVTGECLDPITGLPFGIVAANVSTKIFGDKI